MLVYLSKKIAIPNEVLLNTVAWHKTKGFIACGGDDGLLKVLKLEVTPCKDSALKGLAAPSNLAMNQSLEGHSGHVQVLAWNENHSKLTSSDQNGLIIVWMLYKGMWHEEMINNRNKSVVRHMQWSGDGSKICIVYEDGAVIVGSVDGTRIWGKELKGVVLTHVQWSPDGRTLLFGNGKGEVHIYDGRGTYNSKMAVKCLSNVTGVVKLAGVQWYGSRKGGHSDPTIPSLIVAFDNGCCQLMTHELDDKPVELNCRMSVTSVQWSPDGSQVAVGGSQTFQESKGISCVQFYSCYGKLLHVLRIPGRHLCSSVSWEGSGLRLALGVGPYIYFANVRHSYKWAYLCNTIVYAFKKPDKVEDCVIFWNVKTGQKQAKSVKNLLSITSCADFCLLAAVMDDDSNQCTLLLCDALGTPMDTRFVEFEVKHVCMSQTHIVACSSEGVFVWHYRTTSRLVTELTHVSTKKGRDMQDRLFHVDLGGGVSQTVDFSRVTKTTSDPISCVCCSDKLLVVTRESSMVQVYSLPNLSLVTRQQLESSTPSKIALNSDSRRLSTIDGTGVLHLYDISVWSSGGGSVDLQGRKLGMERKEVWDLQWARDNPDLLAIMEKTRMYIIRGTEPEEPVISSGQICQFDDMHVKSVVLDEIMKDPENPREDFVFELEIKSLRDTRELLEKVGLEDAQQFIQDNPHPRLWRLLAEAALKQLDLEVAEKAYVMSRNYAGIQFVKRLKMLDSEPKQTAEVEAYFMKFDVAEKSYIKMDRRDLALDLRIKYGDWFRVMHIIKSGGAGNDVLLAKACNAIGDSYMDSQKWLHAITYYNNARNYKQLSECYYRLEDYKALEDMAAVIPDNDPLLQSLAQKFMLVGMCAQAVDMFVKMGDIKGAIDCCVQLNQWDMAMELSARHHMEEVESMLTSYANKLLDNNKIISAIQLYRKANKHLEAAKLLQKVAQEGRIAGYLPSKLKKFYVLSALEVEEHLAYSRQRRRVPVGVAGDVDHTLKGLLAEASSKSVMETEMLNQPWRGAEAYHYFILTQNLYYTGKFRECLQTAVYLREYDDLLPPVEFYSLLALVSCACRAFNTCSKAFIKLESLEESEISKERKKLIEKLAMEIFTRNSPKDLEQYSVTCPSCDTRHNEMASRCRSCDLVFTPCVATGTLLQDYQCYTCHVCKHGISKDAINITYLKYCPLCHTSIT